MNDINITMPENLVLYNGLIDKLSIIMLLGYAASLVLSIYIIIKYKKPKYLLFCFLIIFLFSLLDNILFNYSIQIDGNNETITYIIETIIKTIIIMTIPIVGIIIHRKSKHISKGDIKNV